MQKSIPLILLLIFAFLAIPESLAEVYRWKDKNGKVHFSDKPHADATQLKIKPVKPAGIGISHQQIQRQRELLNDFQQKREIQQKHATQTKKKKAAINKYCRDLKNRLRNYKEADYLFSRNKSGEKIDLSDQQKLGEEKKLRAEIADRC